MSTTLLSLLHMYLHTLRFENCELPEENLLLGPGSLKKLLSAFNTQRCLNPAISLGLEEGVLTEPLLYARSRHAFGRSIGQFQGMRWKLADMWREIEAARGLLSGEDRRRHGAERHGDDERQGGVFVVAECGYREGHIRQLMRTVPFTILGDVPLQVVEAEAGFIETAACCPGQWTPWCGAALRDADADAQGELSL